MDDELFSNECGSSNFNNFLNLLGDHVQLKVNTIIITTAGILFLDLIKAWIWFLILQGYRNKLVKNAQLEKRYTNDLGLCRVGKNTEEV